MQWVEWISINLYGNFFFFFCTRPARNCAYIKGHTRVHSCIETNCNARFCLPTEGIERFWFLTAFCKYLGPSSSTQISFVEIVRNMLHIERLHSKPLRYLPTWVKEVTNSTVFMYQSGPKSPIPLPSANPWSCDFYLTILVKFPGMLTV